MIIFMDMEILLCLWAVNPILYLCFHVILFSNTHMRSAFILPFSIILPHVFHISSDEGGPNVLWHPTDYALSHNLSHLIWKLQYIKSLSVYFTYI